MIEKQSPYLSNKDRLQDIIAAIQVMASYRYSARRINAWASILGEKPRSADNWLTIFNDHPEFFRVLDDDEGKHTLILRRAQSRVYNTRTGDELTIEEFRRLPKQERSHISRKPLTTEQTLSLIEVAVTLQNQAVARRQELRWWVHVVVPALSALVGALLGASIG